MPLPRKFAVLATMMFATAIVGLGLSASASSQDFGEEESELHKIMVAVQKENATILRGVRNPAQFKKNHENVVQAAKELAKLGKDAKPHNEEAKEKNQLESWDKLMDEFIEESLVFAEAAEKPDAEQKAVKDGYRKVQATCTACHDVFRPDDF